MSLHILISGCSSGGKSTLLAALAARGYATMEEPGRRVVDEERRSEGTALPWVNPCAFAQRAFSMARADHLQARDENHPVVFFDRGLLDAAVAMEHIAGTPARACLGRKDPYDRRILMAPPWPQIFTQDADRRHGFDEAVAEFDRLCFACAELDYDVVMLPKRPVADRVSFVERIFDVSPPNS